MSQTFVEERERQVESFEEGKELLPELFNYKEEQLEMWDLQISDDY